MLALDLGTSSVRALVCDASAAPLPGLLARRAVEPQQDEDGRAEVDPDVYVAGLVECLDELSAAGSLDGISVVATSSQWHSVLAISADGRPASPVLTWLDTRAPAPSEPADPEAFHRRTGAWVHPLYWTAKAPFVRSSVAGAVRFRGLPDYVRGVLLGDDSTSLSVASGTGLLDVGAGHWDAEALAIAGLAENEVPPISDAPGRLASKWAARWPALATADWQPVLGDGAASNLGAGCATSDALAVTVGTSAALRVVHGGDEAPDLPWGAWRYRVDAERLVTGVAFSGGGVLHAWAVRLLGLDKDAEPTVAPGRSGLLSVPLHAGSRPPGSAPAGSGLVYGLSLDTSAEEFLAATLEGVAIEVARAAELLEKAFGRRLEIVLGGGATHASPWWRRTFAATLDRPVLLASDPEVGARGAAALALNLAVDRPVEIVRPDPGDVKAMAAARSRYDALRNGLDQPH